MRRPAGQSGSASVLVLALSGVLVLIALLLVALGATAVARARAAASADLGALAAASRSLQGEDQACALAARVVDAAGAVLVSCRLVGDTADIQTGVRPDGPLGRLGTARGQARAGPTSPRPVGPLGPPGTARGKAPVGPTNGAGASRPQPRGSRP